ncbi:hypothetical protein [Streptomyces vinaceus]|uniref:hypothetical protein n=1 Tax=Streptomyces vinaceus TaxID=1960 RepID=UPI0036888F79
MNQEEVGAMGIEFHENVTKWASRNYSYSRWEFEEAAESNGWKAIGMITEPYDDGPVSSETSSRHYYGETWAFAKYASNAEHIISELERVDPEAAHWDYGPGRSFIYDMHCERVVEVVEEVEGCLASYGYLNEDRASEIEYEENHPSERECYADESCSCDVATHECRDEVYYRALSGDIDETTEDIECSFCDHFIDLSDYADTVKRAVADKFHDELRSAGQMTIMDFFKEAGVSK